jgi:glycosyltransferase involved in cell wall biosynthesis
MKVLIANKYLYKVGGPEVLMFQTAELLERHGHHVSFFGMADRAEVAEAWRPYLAPTVDYDQLGQASLRGKIQASVDLIYSRAAARQIARLVDAARPDIVHFHNICHQLSPSILPPIRRRGIPTVFTAHDYKLICPNYRLYTHDGICYRCLKGQYYHAVAHRCIKDSRAKSMLNAVEMYLHHRVWDIYRKNIDVFIALNQFTRNLLIQAGYAPEKIQILPNFVDVHAYQPCYTGRDYIVYFGRLVPEKGVKTLLEAVRLLSTNLVIVGDGFQRAELEAVVSANGMTNVVFVGPCWDRSELAAIIGDARLVVVPSEWPENSPLVVYESFAWGKPVIGARVGGITELIDDGVDGLLFEAGNAEDLRYKIQQLFDRPAYASDLGHRARQKVEREFSSEVYYERLLSIYAAAR